MAKRLTQEEFEKRIEEQGNGEFTVLEKYKNNRTPTLTRHEVCGHEWKIRPDDFFEEKDVRFVTEVENEQHKKNLKSK